MICNPLLSSATKASVSSLDRVTAKAPPEVSSVPIYFGVACLDISIICNPLPQSAT